MNKESLAALAMESFKTLDTRLAPLRLPTHDAVVWIVKEQMVRDGVGSNAMDYSPAMQFGEIRFITRTDMVLHPGSLIQQNWNEDVAAFAMAYDPKNDYIIPTGQPAAIFAVGHALGRLQKAPRYLVWRREENRYRAFESPFPGNF